MPSPTALWVSPVPEIGGVGRHLMDVARVGIPGWNVLFAAPEGPLLQELRTLGAAVEPAEIGPGINPAQATRTLRRLIARTAPSVVHSHLPRADLLVAAASPGLPVSLVTTEHTITPDRLLYHSAWKATVMEALHTARLRRFAAVIAVSDATKATMRQRWGADDAVTVIRNGIDRPADAVRQPGTRFLSLSRLSPEKNIHTTVRAFPKIREVLPGATLTVAGIGPLEDELKELTASLGVADAVTFPGFVSSDDAIAHHDVLIQPSSAENLSYALLDAAAHGLGVAASPVGGNPEFLPAHCLVPPGDAAALAAVAVEQATDPERRPTIPEDIPTVEGMTAAIAEVYGRLGRR